MLNIGLIGIGFMGWIHYLAYQRITTARVAAICTRDLRKQQGDWTSIQGNFGPPGELVNLIDVKVYQAWQDLIRDPTIDAVDICLPPALHKTVSLAALQSGKHVLCEKPMALNALDCREMLQAARQAQRHLMVAHVLPYISQFAYVMEAVRDGRFGTIQSAHFKRIISDPTWLPDFYERQVTGGPMLDLHIHDAHLMRSLFGMPIDVTASGWRHLGVAKYAHMLYRFADEKRCVTAASGVNNASARGFTHGFEVQFERAVLNFEFAAHNAGTETLGMMLYEADQPAVRVQLPESDEIEAFAAELTEFAAAIQCSIVAENHPMSGSLAADAVAICEAVESSVASSHTVRIV